jgi:hypothetical protein
MAVINMDMTNVLQGKTGNLVPVCVFSEKPKVWTGPLPGLTINVDLQPGKTYQSSWALAALPDDQASFTLASNTLNRTWDGEIAQIELQNESQELEITTGDPEWDAAFAFSQNIAWGLFLSPSFHLPYSSFVLSRHPDQGYSMRGDGSDYSHQWNGQNALDSYYMSNLVLPGGASLVEGLIRNFLAVQDQNGFIDWKPGLAGQRSRHLAQPLLATLALVVDGCKTDHAWLAEIFPGLLKFFQVWFQPEHDRDGDGFPEWDHPLQSGAEDNPIYDRWHPQSQGVEISTLESPALGALLYRECQSLAKIAEFLEQKDALTWLVEKQSKLRKTIAETWDDVGVIYRYRDFQTHLSPASVELAKIEKMGSFELNLVFDTPQRILIRVDSQHAGEQKIVFTLHGQSIFGEMIEETSQPRLFWGNGTARYTSQNIFKSLERFDITGLMDNDRVKLSNINYTLEDSTLLLPLWAGIPENEQARRLVQETILARYLQAYGIPPCPLLSQVDEPADHSLLSLPWNLLFGEALLEYGYRQEAADLVIRLMNAILYSFRTNGSFRECYHAQTGQPYGEINNLRGLAPIGLFLQVLGIKKIQTGQVILDGINPFPWPVTVKYQGIIITCHPNDTVITFPGGQTIAVSGPGPHRVSLS